MNEHTHADNCQVWWVAEVIKRDGSTFESGKKNRIIILKQPPCDQLKGGMFSYVGKQLDFGEQINSLSKVNVWFATSVEVWHEARQI